MINAIVAITNSGGIGINNQMPWHIPEDLQVFKAITLGKSVYMGSKTHESIGKPLPGRDNHVFSASKSYTGVQVHKELLEASVMDGWVIGGRSIYQAYMPDISYMHITRISGQYDCDTFLETPSVAATMGWTLIDYTPSLVDSRLVYELWYQNRAGKYRSEIVEKEILDRRKASQYQLFVNQLKS